MPLEAFIGKMSGADTVSVEDEGILIGGAIQENRGFKVIINGGIYSGSHQMVLRGEAKAAIPESNPLEQQFKILKIVESEGIKVPKPYWYCNDINIIGKRFFLMNRVKGETLGNRVTRKGEQIKLAAALGQELARIHKISPHRHDLSFLNSISVSPSADAILKYQKYLDNLPEPHPALEWTLRWLELQTVESEQIVLCHRDFRTGNYIVENSDLVSILDWEFAGWGDRHEDIAWFCARCWRFLFPTLHAGGIAPRRIFYEAYEREANQHINRDLVYYWEIMAHVRWAVVALQQSMRHRSGQEESLELALIGRRLAELEYECLRLTGALKE